ncbi:pectate lyase [Luteimonas sp. R10]|uniref:pectate lyase n=1 Tax=Luteimonas sp. R10 TaxID=3108176 RepID=UPI00308F03ED|nr:pectate lyase [Luteimonas sp. R10]
MAAGAVQGLGLAALLFAAASLLPAAAAARSPDPIPLDGFADAIHHWRNAHGGGYPRHAPDDIVAIADNIVLQQRRDGGWRENRDPVRILGDDERRRLEAERDTAGGSFDNVALRGVRLETFAAEPVRYRYHSATTDRRLVEGADAPLLWARFYDLADNSVVLATREGERVARYADIPRERRTGYQWYATGRAICSSASVRAGNERSPRGIEDVSAVVGLKPRQAILSATTKLPRRHGAAPMNSRFALFFE